MRTQPLIPFDYYVSADNVIFAQVFNFDNLTVKQEVVLDFGTSLLKGVVVEQYRTTVLVKVGI